MKTAEQVYERYSEFMDELAADTSCDDVHRMSREEFDLKWKKACDDPDLMQEWVDFYENGYGFAKENATRFMAEALPASMYPPVTT